MKPKARHQPATIADNSTPAANPKPPRTDAQREASRINGAKSQGPVTPEGKHESSKSAIRHGLTATVHTLLMTEDPIQYKEVLDAFIDDLRPATKAELRLVEKLGNLDWRLERLVMMETCVLNMEVGVNADEIMTSFSNIDGIGFIVEAWKKSLSATHCLDLLRRYLGTLQHQFNTTLANFLKFETRRLARKHDRDHDPEFLPPYQRPRLDSLDPEPESEQDPEPGPTARLDEPGKSRQPVTPIDIHGRQNQQNPEILFESPDQNHKPSRPGA